MRPPSRVLFLSANMGTGHACAAEAIGRALLDREGRVEFRVVNSFQFASQLGKVVEDSYIQMLKSFPTLYGLLYESRHRPTSVSGVRRWFNHRFAGNFKQLLDSYQPHAIVCTHAFPFGVMAAVQEKYGLGIPCLGVVTDFVVHPFWIYENMSHYAVAAPEMAAQLAARGVSESAIRVTGIPIDPRFARTPDSPDLRRRLDLDSGLPVVLVMGGGLGMGPVGEILRSLQRITRPMHVVILTGKNKKLKQRLEAEAGRLQDLPTRVRVLGYVDNVCDYMNCADLLVTKPGGLTSAEALACGLPMIIVHPLPGQEVRNTRYLLAKKVAIRVPHEENLHEVIEDLLERPEARRAMSAAARRLALPHAAYRIADLVCGLLDHQEQATVPGNEARVPAYSPAPARIGLGAPA